MIDNTKLAFSSQARYLRVALKGSEDFSVGAGTLIVSIPHNLDYKPYYKIWYKINGIFVQHAAGPASFNLCGQLEQTEDAYADTSNLYVNFFPFGGSFNGTVYYRIYAEPQT